MDAKPPHNGKLRDNTGGRGWRAKLYEPTTGYPYHRVKFKDPATGRWPDRPVPPGEDPEEHFGRVEAALDHKVAQPSRRSDAAPTIADLAVRYFDWLRSKGRDSEYINNRQNLLDVWMLRASKDLLVALVSGALPGVDRHDPLGRALGRTGRGSRRRALGHAQSCSTQGGRRNKVAEPRREPDGRRVLLEAIHNRGW